MVYPDSHPPDLFATRSPPIAPATGEDVKKRLVARIFLSFVPTLVVRGAALLSAASSVQNVSF